MLIMEGEALIEYKNVSKAYPPAIAALDNVSFQIRAGEFVSLVGRSGAGKSTLLKLLFAQELPSAGTVFFNGFNVAQLRYSQLPDLRRKIGVVFQDFKLLPFKTAFENVAYVLAVMGENDKVIEKEVREVLDIVGLADKGSQFPLQLSGGEQQRVALARALVHRPRIIMADEPTGNLDPYNTRDIIRLLVKIHELGTTVLLATHNREVINRLGKRVITLEAGRLIRDEERGRFVI